MPSIGISKRQSSSSSVPRLPSALLAKLPVRRKSRSSSSTISSSGTLRLLSKTKAKTKKNGDNSKVPKRKSNSIIISNATDGLNTELVVEPVISPVSVLSENVTLSASKSASFVEDTATTITSTGSVTSAKQNDTKTTTNDEDISAEYSAPSAPSFVSTVNNTPTFTTNDDKCSLVVIEEEEVVEEVAVSQQSQESWILSPANSISNNVDASSTEASSNAAPDVPAKDKTLCEGTFVRIISNGKYKGKVGIVSRVTEKMVYVTIEGIDKDPRISKASVEIVEEEQLSHATHRSTSTPPASTSTKTESNTESESSTHFEVGQTIGVINENSDYYGKNGTIVKVNSKMLRVSIDGVGEKSLSKKSVEIVMTSTPKANQPNSIFRSDRSPKSSCRSPNDLQVQIPLDCDTGISSISLATGIVTPTNNVQQIDIPSPQNSISSSTSTSESQSATTFGQGAQLIIKAGKYKGERAILVKSLPRSLRVAIDGQEVTVRKTSVFRCDNRVAKSLTSRNSAVAGRSARLSRNSLSATIGGSGENWKVPDSTGGGTRFGSRIIHKVRISKKSVGDDNNFLSHFLGDRVKIVEVPLNCGETTDPFDITVLEDGRTYELMSVKIREDNEGPNMQYCRKQCAHLIYCQTRGPRLEPISVETELSKLADFSSLTPRKAMARIELLQSPALKLPKGPGIFFLNAKEACEIDDNGNDGCGFIDEAFLSSLLPGSKYRDTLAIQIRFLAPSMGLFKGMLMRRRIVEGPPIQLTPTMKKVAASLSNTSDDRACLIITQAGKNPSPLNQYIGRMIDPTLKPPPKKSFNDMLKQKPLNKKRLKDKVDMIPRLLLALGAQTPSLEMYLKESLTMNGLAHAYVVGVADPTDALPAGFVFVTGFSNVSTPNGQIFVTRSPCAKASDARMIPMVISKPDGTTQLDWDWLNSLPFGAIIFANPKKGAEPLPAQIASGDLDGDRYFILWDRAILQQVKTDPIVENAIVEEGDGNENNGKKPNHNWLKEAQQLMVDSASYQDLGALTGCLYKLAEKTADSSNLYMRDPDAIAFANAYNQALEYGKHGRKIKLPKHLHAEVPARLRRLLSDSN